MRSKTVVYTCITGGYDKLKPIAHEHSDIDFVCITDSAKSVAKGWERIGLVEFLAHHFVDGCMIEIPEDDVRRARVIKILGWIAFLQQGYEQTMWIDGNMQVTTDLNELFNAENVQKADIVTFKHHSRICTYAEGFTCIEFNKGEPEEILHQLAAYKEDGYPINHGMVHSSMIIRNKLKQELIAFSYDWIQQVNTHSYRDQLSFNYCFRNYQKTLTLGILDYAVLNAKFGYDTTHA